MSANASIRIPFDDVNKAIEFAQNSIICKASFKRRPELMGVRMFDRFTNSNAEAEHSALKNNSSGLKSNQKLSTLLHVTTMQSKLRDGLKKQDDHLNMNKTDAKSLCTLSTYVTKPCFNDLQHRVSLATRCVSKQLSCATWQVIYQRERIFDDNEVNIFLPYIKRIRTVHKSPGGFLTCSCKTHERYGYPCHHIFKVLKCYDTKYIKKEWIHVRWTNAYNKYHYSSDCSNEQRQNFELLYDSFPIGPHHVSSTATSRYPQYHDSCIGVKATPEMFGVPDFQIMSRHQFGKTWIHANNSNNPALKELLGYKNDALYNGILFSSQENTKLSQSILSQPDDSNDFELNDVDDNDDNDVPLTTLTEPVYPSRFDYTTHNVILKHAVQLCGSDVNAHRRLYDSLTAFVHSEEINNDDNAAILKKRNYDHINDKERDTLKNAVTVVSSNKVVNTRLTSTKRTKAAYER